MSQPDPLRDKLKALVGELHQQAAIYRRGQEVSDERQALAYTQCARKLAALLAESEPVKCRHGKDCVECEQEREPAQDQHICSAGWRGEPCEICGKSVGGPDCEAEDSYPKPATKAWGLSGYIRILPPAGEAKLPLGHPYVECRRLHGRRNTHDCWDAAHCDDCGQPRSAHEPK